jgi:uncharacterized protein (TIRG00374 family)
MLSERTQRWLKIALTLGVSLFFLALFIRGLDLGEVADSLAGANYVYILPGLALFGVSIVLRSLRWRYFLLPADNLTWRDLLPSVLIGYAGNNLLPLRAGELVRAQHLADRFGVPRMRTFGALLMERLFDAAVLAAFLLWGLLIAGSGAAYLGVGALLAVGAVGGFIVCTAVALKPGLPTRIAALPIPLLTSRIRQEIAGLGGSFQGGFTVLTSPRRFLWTAGASIGAWACELAMYWFVAEAFELDASVPAIALAGAAANVSLSLPLAQGGVGAFEFAATEALREFDVAKISAAAYALALHFFLIVPVSLVGLAVLWRSTLASSPPPAAATQAPALDAHE